MSPLGLPPRGRSSTGKSSKSGGTVVLMLVAAIPSFILGTMSSVLFGLTNCSNNNISSSSLGGGSSSATIDRLVQEKIQSNIESLCQEHAGRVLENHAENDEAERASKSLFPSETVGRFAVGMSRVSKQEFTDQYDMGVPLDPASAGQEEILLLYSHEKALPTSYTQDDRQTIPSLELKDAIEHCEYLNIILTDHGQRNQCVAIIPQYESYHIQKWMRIDNRGKLDPKEELQMVSRGHTAKGRSEFGPPDLKTDTRKHWKMLQSYLENIDEILDELKPILDGIAIDNTVIVLVCNFGQSELLMNFVCSARKRNFDLSNVIVFTTDQETTDLANSLGITAYFEHRNFGKIPSKAAGRYGDAKFVAMMMAKVICVQLVSMLGFDFLFQDVDIVWYKNPLQYFKNDKSLAANYDVFFQDDGGHSIRYAPYSANSGFYFVRYNPRTRHFLTALLMAGDIVLETDSHQQALIAVLNEHVSLFGLKAKVLSRDMEEFPGGYQFHQRNKKYMRSLFNGELNPYIFHMSWTLNKNNKLKFFRQMGEWYVQDQCIETKFDDIQGNDDVPAACCSAEPLFSCHYRDKPSIKPCRDSPPIDKGRPSWW